MIKIQALIRRIPLCLTKRVCAKYLGRDNQTAGARIECTPLENVINLML
jgi:hypothetical protein